MVKFFPQQYRERLTDELEDLRRILDELETENLTAWESDFVLSLQDRLETYKGETSLSPKQWEWVDRLCDKYVISP